MPQCHDYGHYHQIVDRSAHEEWEQANPGTPLAADPHAGALAGADVPPAGGDTGDQGEGE